MSERERYYLEHVPVESPLPVPPPEVAWVSIPEGWRRVPGAPKGDQIKADKEFWEEVYLLAWEGRSADVQRDRWAEYWLACQVGSYRW